MDVEKIKDVRVRTQVGIVARLLCVKVYLSTQHNSGS